MSNKHYKVSDLIAHLQQLPPDAEIWTATDNGVEQRALSPDDVLALVVGRDRKTKVYFRDMAATNRQLAATRIQSGGKID